MTFLDETNGDNYGWAYSHIDFNRQGLTGNFGAEVPTPAELFEDENRFNTRVVGRAKVFLGKFLASFKEALSDKSVTPGQVDLNSVAKILADTAAHELGHELGLYHASGQDAPTNIMASGGLVPFTTRLLQTRNFFQGPDPALVPDSLKVALHIPLDGPDGFVDVSRFPEILAATVDTESNKDADVDGLSNFTTQGPVSVVNGGYRGVSPEDGKAFILLSQNPSDTTTTLHWSVPFTANSVGVRFDINVLSNSSSLTPGRHILDAVLIGPSGETTLAQIDLSTLETTPDQNPLGRSTGWVTINAPDGEDSGTAGLTGQLELRLVSDEGAGGEQVAVVIGRLSAQVPAPTIITSTPTTPLPGRQLVFGPDTGNQTTATVILTNGGSGPLSLTGASIIGTGFSLLSPLPGPINVNPGESTTILVRLTDPNHAANAVLRLVSNEPVVPIYDLALHADPSTYPPAPATPPCLRPSLRRL